MVVTQNNCSKLVKGNGSLHAWRCASRINVECQNAYGRLLQAITVPTYSKCRVGIARGLSCVLRVSCKYKLYKMILSFINKSGSK